MNRTTVLNSEKVVKRILLKIAPAANKDLSLKIKSQITYPDEQ
jgi:hypothetical protein